MILHPLFLGFFCQGGWEMELPESFYQRSSYNPNSSPYSYSYGSDSGYGMVRLDERDDMK